MAIGSMNGTLSVWKSRLVSHLFIVCALAVVVLVVVLVIAMGRTLRVLQRWRASAKKGQVV